MPRSGDIRQNRRALIVFTAGLFVFLLIFDSFIIRQQRQIALTELAEHAKQEMQLLGQLTATALTQGDYAVVEQALTDWGRLTNDVLKIHLITANDFLLAAYDDPRSSDHTRSYTGSVDYGRGKTARIEVLKDLQPTDRAIHRLALQLFGFSTVLVALLGIFLHRLAIRPLQREIDQHVQTERRLRQQAVELQTLNDELASFNYSLSHDLRTPLRAITSYSQIIQKDCGSQLSSECQQFFERIIATGKHMATLIDDILTLSQVSRIDITPESVDLSALAQHIIDMHTDCDNVHCTCLIQPGLSATGNPKLLEQLLDNLLGNAIKYSSKQSTAEIHFGASQQDHQTVYFVSDNGTGFDMRYADKVFTPFQRLHDQQDYPGTGIGMATAMRIVKRHHGRIWVESEPGVGTTFYFTLGTAPARDIPGHAPLVDENRQH